MPIFILFHQHRERLLSPTNEGTESQGSYEETGRDEIAHSTPDTYNLKYQEVCKYSNFCLISCQLRVLCTVPGGHSLFQILDQSEICLCILAPINLVSMATNKHTLLFYFLILKLKLVSHFLSNRHEMFTQATLIVLLKKKRVLIFGYQLQMLSFVEINL